MPFVPGVSFYHTTSKQLLEPGEHISEDDDDVDESWLAQNQDQALKELGMTGTAKEFIRAFNHHLAREQPDSSILTREALIRFARRYHESLQNVEWQRHFRAKLNQLKGPGIIDDDCVEHCVRGLRQGQEVRSPDDDRDMRQGGDAMNKSIANDEWYKQR